MILPKRVTTSIASVLLLSAIGMFVGCSSTKEASIPQGWSYNVNWDNFNTAQFTSTEHIIVQNKQDMIMLEGASGKALERDIRERGGFFSEIGRAYTEQVKEEVLLSQRVETKYFFKELPELNTLLLFNRTEGNNTVRSLDLITGKQNWENTSYVWNLNEHRDIANIAINQLMDGAAEAKAASELALQTRMVQSMIQEVPEKDGFLFRTVEQLHMIDNKSGSVRWTNENVAGTGIGAVQYLPESDQLLVATNMSGLRDVIENADEEMALKQILLIGADNGEIIWQSEYEGRSAQLSSIRVEDEMVVLNFYGGSTEFFNMRDGERLFGTRDGEVEAGTQMASYSTDYNMLETPETAIPLIGGQYVYGVNPSKVKAVGVSDKQLQKFDLQTGEIIWEYPLENTLDVRDMRFHNDNLIVRLSAPVPDEMSTSVSNIVGNKKPLGFYAFSKDEGILTWELTKPFEKHVTNVIYGDNEAWAAGGESIYKFSLEDGKVLADSSLADLGIGEARHIFEAGGNIVVLGAKGMAVVTKENLTTVYNEAPNGRLQSFDIGDRFFVMSMQSLLSKKQNIHVYNLRSLSKITDFTLELPDGEIYGDLGARGYVATGDFKQLITLTESGLTSYKIY